MQKQTNKQKIDRYVQQYMHAHQNPCSNARRIKLSDLQFPGLFLAYKLDAKLAFRALQRFQNRLHSNILRKFNDVQVLNVSCRQQVMKIIYACIITNMTTMQFMQA